MNKKFVLSLTLILASFFYLSQVQADGSEPSFNQQTGELSLPEVSFPDGSTQGPFILKLNKDNQFELAPGTRSKIQQKFIANKNIIPSVNASFTELNIPYLCIKEGIDNNMCVSLILKINLIRNAYIFSVAFINIITAEFLVSGTVSSNDNAANYTILDNSTVNITPYLFGWCIFMQIQGFPANFEHGTLLGYMARSFSSAGYLFAALGKIGILHAFSNGGAQVETTTNGKAKFIINNQGDPEILISGQHTDGQAWEAHLTISERMGAFFLSLLFLYFTQIAGQT